MTRSRVVSAVARWLASICDRALGTGPRDALPSGANAMLVLARTKVRLGFPTPSLAFQDPMHLARAEALLRILQAHHPALYDRLAQIVREDTILEPVWEELCGVLVAHDHIGCSSYSEQGSAISYARYLLRLRFGMPV